MVCADLLHAYTAANKTDPPEHGEENMEPGPSSFGTYGGKRRGERDDA